ncbi:MAG: glycosyltransferase family 4 protein [Lentisphaerae bacterium]|nr:glycosyltransferase family 4 protein [Lentisphaerota bacterium]
MNILMLAEVSACCLTGGAARTLREQAIGLKQRGHNVCLLVRAPLTDAKPQAVFNGIPEFRYAVYRKSAPAFVLSSIIRSVGVFDSLVVRGFPVEVGVIHQALAGFGPLLLRRCRVRAWIYYCHSLAYEEYLTRNPPPSGLGKRWLYWLHAGLRFFIEHWVIRRCATVVVESRFMRARVMAKHRVSAERIGLIPAAADIGRFRPVADRLARRAQLGLPPDRPAIFTVRNLIPRMGLENLIKALAEPKIARENLLLLIGGEGPLRPHLERLIRTLKLEAKIVLKGFIPEDELAAYYQCADLVVMPSAALEGFGLVTVEALACGTPVLGTPVGAIPEILSQIDPRLLAKGNDARSIAAALADILLLIRNNPVELNQLSAKGLRQVANVYNWGKHNEQLEAVLLAQA